MTWYRFVFILLVGVLTLALILPAMQLFARLSAALDAAIP